MHALLFEVAPRAGHEDHYFTHAAALRPLLAAHEGLLFLDRFRSLTHPNIILSHSHWRDEAALAKWRTDPTHHRSQAAGRNQHFRDYRIRIAHVLQNYTRGKETTEWSHDGAYRDPAAHKPRFVVIVATQGEAIQNGGEAFRSVNVEDSYLAVSTPEAEADGRALVAGASRSAHVTNAMLASVSRDYGMFDREEAPQYFPERKARA